MKKQFVISIKFVAILVIVLIIADGFISYGIKKNATNVFAKPNKICNNIDLPQIAVFSSSVGEMGYDCNVIANAANKSVYNFSLNGTRFMQYKGLIDELNRISKTTEIVVLSEAFFTFKKSNSINNIERYLPCISNDNIYNSLHNLQPDLSFKCRYVPFYKYIVASNNYYLQSFIGWKNYLTHKKSIDSLKGQTKVYRNWEADQDSIWKYAKQIPVDIDSEIVNIYKKTIDNLVANNKKVVIAIAPIYMPKGQTIIDFTQFRKTLQSMADNKNIFFLDFSESMVDKKYFYNVQHMNAYGASVYSKRFADSLAQLKIVN